MSGRQLIGLTFGFYLCSVVLHFSLGLGFHMGGLFSNGCFICSMSKASIMLYSGKQPVHRLVVAGCCTDKMGLIDSLMDYFGRMVQVLDC